MIAVSESSEPVRILACLLPATHGIGPSQDIMLRGAVRQPWEFLARGVIAALTLLVAWGRLRHGMTREWPPRGPGWPSFWA